jgi:3-phosphoshikimate 1-carboxyvinyltransferase
MSVVELAPRGPLRGRLRVPGDKSISHRALLFAAIAPGESVLRGLAPGEDVQSTRRAVGTLGLVVADAPDVVRVTGLGWAGLDRNPFAPPLELDCGNSGTTSRLLLGLLAGRSGRFRLTGDASLSRRPMRRVTGPLRAVGASIEGGDTLPLVVGAARLRGGEQHTGVASAQVKSALILAALQAEGDSVVREPERSRDHTERMLRAMGAPLEPADATGLAWRIGGGGAPLRPLALVVPGDPSSAAYAVALATLVPGSSLRVEGVSLNPTRLGFYRLLARMGARLRYEVAELEPEPRGTIDVEPAALRGIEVGPADVPEAVDELPLLAVVAAAAEGRTTIRGAGELRVKESDRLAATARLLQAFGARVTETEEGLVVAGPTRWRPAAVDAEADHRIAMCAAVAAGLADAPSTLTGAEWVRISYPGFFDDLDRLAG